MKILILFAHPALQKSRVNKYLVEDLQELEGVTFHDLYQQYPEFDIDIAREQKLLTDHDVIILQHPFFWYSTPAILKEWQDLVLEHNWAYGKSGNALQDKWMLNVLTTGGRASAYHSEGYNRHTIREFLLPIERTAILCKMHYLPPYIIAGTHSIKPESIQQHRQAYRRLLRQLQQGTLNLADVQGLDALNQYLNR